MRVNFAVDGELVDLALRELVEDHKPRDVRSFAAGSPRVAPSTIRIARVAIEHDLPLLHDNHGSDGMDRASSPSSS